MTKQNLDNLRAMAKKPGVEVIYGADKIYVRSPEGNFALDAKHAKTLLQSNGIKALDAVNLPSSVEYDNIRRSALGEVKGSRSAAYDKRLKGEFLELSKRGPIDSVTNGFTIQHIENVYKKANRATSPLMPAERKKRAIRNLVKRENIQESWNKYASAKKLPIDSPISKDYVARVEQLVSAMLESPEITNKMVATRRKTPLINSSFKTSPGLKRLKNDHIDPTLSIGQDVMVLDGKAYLFSDRYVSDNAMAKTTASLKALFNTKDANLRGVNQVVAVTPKGYKRGFVKGEDTISVDGRRINVSGQYKKAYSTFAAAAADRASKPMDAMSSDLAYQSKQKLLEAQALDQLYEVSKVAISTANTGRPLTDMGTLTYDDMVAYSYGLKDSQVKYGALQKYTKMNGATLDTLLPRADKNSIVDAVDTFSTSLKHAEYGELANRHKNIVNTAKRLGVGLRTRDMFNKQGKKVGTEAYDVTSELYATDLRRMDPSQAYSVINAMEDTLVSTTELRGKRSFPNKELFRKELNSNPNKLARLLLQNENNPRFFENYGLLEKSLDNPLVNLEGTLNSKLISAMKREVLKDAYGGKTKPLGSQILAMAELLPENQRGSIKQGMSHFDFVNGVGKNLRKRVPRSAYETITDKRDYTGRRVMDNIIGFGKDGEPIHAEKLSALIDSPDIDYSVGPLQDGDINAKQADRINDRYKELKDNSKVSLERDEHYIAPTDKQLYQQAANENALALKYNSTTGDVKGLIDSFRDNPTPQDISKAVKMLSIFEHKKSGVSNPGSIRTRLKTLYSTMLENELDFKNNPQNVYTKLTPYMINNMSNTTSSDFTDITSSGKKLNNTGLVQFLDDNHADYSKLMQAYRGSESSTFRLVNSPNTTAIRNKILTALNPTNSIHTDPALYSQLTDYYKNTNILTNFDLAALGTIDQYTLGTTTSQAGPVLNRALDPNEVITSILKDHTASNSLRVRPQINQTRAQTIKRIESGNATTHNKNAAARFLADNDLLGAKGLDARSSHLANVGPGRLKAVGLSLNKSLADFLDAKATVDYNSGTMTAKQFKSPARDKLFKANVTSIAGSMTSNINDLIKQGRYASAEAQLGALESFAHDLDLGAKTKSPTSTTKRAADLFSVVTDGKLSERLDSAATRNIRNQVLTTAVSRGFVPYQEGFLEGTNTLKVDSLVARDLKDQFLSNDTLGTSTKKVLANVAFRDEILKNLRFRGIEQQDAEFKRFTGDTTVKYTTKPESRFFTDEDYRTKYLARLDAENKPQVKQEALKSFATYENSTSSRARGKTNPLAPRRLRKGVSVAEAGKNIRRHNDQVSGNSRTQDLEELRKAFGSSFTMLNSGGKIPGKGHKDEVPALLTKGEVVVDRKTSERLGIHTQADYDRFKGAVQDGTIGKFSTGGPVNYFTAEDIFGPGFDPGPLGMSSATKPLPPVSITNINVPNGPGSGGSINNLSVDAEKLTVHMDKNSFSTFVDANGKKLDAGGASHLLNQLDDQTKAAKYQGVLSAQKYGFTTDEYKNITAGKIDSAIAAKIDAMDILDAEDLFGSGSEANKTFKNNLKSQVMTGPGGAAAAGPDTRSEKLRRSFNRLSGDDSKLFKQITGLDISSLDGIDDVEQKLAKFKDTVKDFKFDKSKIPTGETANRLRQFNNVLGTTASILGDEAFDNDFGKQKAGIDELKSGVGRSIGIKEGADARARQFGDMVKQNSLFAASYIGIGAVQGAIGSTIGFFADFDDAMGNLQAITGETTEGLNVMKDSVKQVSTETKFSALEIADASTILGQAGFGSTDIQKSLKGVVELATATGSKLEDSTQVLTSALTIWDNSITDSSKFANQFTAAINESKLDINALGLTLQYAGNIAASANVSVTDLVTSTSLLKDAGIKRGSTLGTGQRLLISDFANPSVKFSKSLDDVGITLTKFKKVFQTEGLEGTVKLMRDAGYGLASASQGMEVREKSIFLALSNQIDKFGSFRQSISDTNAAQVANATQMEAVGNKFKNMVNSWQISVNDTMENSAGITRTVLDALTVDIKEKDPTKSKLRKDSDLTVGEIPENGVSGMQALVTASVGAMLAAPAAKAYLGVAAQGGGVAGKLAGRAGGIAGVAGGAVAGGLFAAEGNALSGTILGGIAAGGLVLADKMADRFDARAEKAGKAPLSKGARYGLLGAAALGTSIVTDSAQAGGVVGAAGSGLTAGAIAGSLFGGPVGWAVGIATAGATLAGFFEEEAPTKGTYQALAVGVNELKASNTELEATYKAGLDVNSAGNYAIRPGKDDSDTEVRAKQALVTGGLDELDKATETLQAVVQSFTGTDTFGTISNRVSSYSEDELRGNKFTIDTFKSDGEKLVQAEELFTGTFTEAVQKMQFSLADAQSELINGTVGDKVYGSLLETEATGLESELEGAKNLTGVTNTISQHVVKPINDMAKSVPALFVKNFDANRELLKQGLDAGRESAGDLDSIFSNREARAYDSFATKQLAAFDQRFITAGFNATNPTAARQVGTHQLAKLLQDGMSQQDALSDKSIENTRSNFVTLTKKYGGINQLQDIANQGRVQLDDAQEKAVKVFRSLSKAVSGFVTGNTVSQGAELTQIGLDIGRDLIPAMKELTSSYRASANTYGTDITSISAKKLTKTFGHTVAQGLGNFLATNAFKDDPGTFKATAIGSVSTQGISNLTPTALKADQALVAALKESASQVDSFMTAANRLTSLAEAEQSGSSAYRFVQSKQRAVDKLGVASLGSANTLINQASTFASLDSQSTEQLRGNFGAKLQFQFDAAKTRGLRQIETQLGNQLTQIGVGYTRGLEDIGTNLSKQQRDLKTGYDNQVKAVGVRQGIALENIDIKFAQGVRDIGISRRQGLEDIALSKTQGLEDIATMVVQGQEDIMTRYTRQLESLNIRYDQTRDDIETKGVRGNRDIDTNEFRAYRDLSTRNDRTIAKIDLTLARGLEDLDLRRKYVLEDADTALKRGDRDIRISELRGEASIDRQFARNLDKIAISFERGMEDIATNQQRNMDKLQLSYARGVRDINNQFARGIEKINIDFERGQASIALSQRRGQQDIALSGTRGRQDIDLSNIRGQQDIATRQTRGLQDIATSFSRGVEKLGINTSRSNEDLNVKISRGLEDLNTNYERATEDINKSYAYKLADISKSYLRQVASSFRSYSHNLDQIRRSYNDNIASIGRGRSDALEAFNRSLDRPQVVTMDPGALLKVSDNLNDLSLAFDANKAALIANTSAVKQQIAILKSQEDITKQAYKDAYKKVGGQVYNDDGSVNQDFTDAYSNFIDSNSESVIDTMLEQAINRAFGGSGFDIQQALTSPEYFADQVSNPSTGVTTSSSIIGSGLSSDELAAALAGAGQGEVRISTTAGVILEAQGGMEGALFDLEGTMIQFDIKVREAGYQLQSALATASSNLSFALQEAAIKAKEAEEDAEEARRRSQESANEGFQRALEDLLIAQQRGSLDITTAFNRGMEDLVLSNKQANEDLILSLTRSQEDLATGVARAGEDLQLKLARAGEDLATKTRRASEDLKLNMQYAMDDLVRQMAYAGQDLRIRIQDAAYDLAVSIQNAINDLNLSKDRQTDDAEDSRDYARQELAIKIEQLQADLVTKTQDFINNATTSIERSEAKLIENDARARTDWNTAMLDGAADIRQAALDSKDTLKQQLEDSFIDAGKAFIRGIDEANRNKDQGFEDLDTKAERAGQALETSVERATAKLETSIDRAMESLINKTNDAIDASNKAYQENLTAMAVQYDEAGKGLLVHAEDAVQKLNTQITRSVEDANTRADQAKVQLEENLHNMAVNVTKTVTDGLNLWLDDVRAAKEAGVFKIAIDKAALETQLNDSLSKLQINQNLIVENVAAMYSAALSSDAMKQAVQTLGTDVGGQFTKIFTDTQTTVSKQMKSIDKAIKLSFDASVTATKGMVTKLETVTLSIEEIVRSNTKADLSPVVQNVALLGDAMLEMSKVGTETETAAKSLSVGAGSLTTSVKAVTVSLGEAAQIGPAMLALAQGIQISSYAAINSLGSMAYVGNTMEIMANQIAQAAYRAVATIQAATYTATNTGYRSKGGPITPLPSYASAGQAVAPGEYGGGDKYQYMLEAGEYVVRKEIVRDKGLAWFENLNAGINQEVQGGGSVTTGLPSSARDGINVNIGVSASVGIDSIEAHMDQIADGVKRVFEEYS